MIAIRRAIAKTRYGKLTQEYAAAGRNGENITCAICGEEYVIYYGPRVEYAEALQLFNDQVEREHVTEPPHHRDGFAIGENFPEREDTGN